MGGSRSSIFLSSWQYLPGLQCLTQAPASPTLQSAVWPNGDSPAGYHLQPYRVLFDQMPTGLQDIISRQCCLTKCRQGCMISTPTLSSAVWLNGDRAAGRHLLTAPKLHAYHLVPVHLFIFVYFQSGALNLMPYLTSLKLHLARIYRTFPLTKCLKIQIWKLLTHCQLHSGIHLKMFVIWQPVFKLNINPLTLHFPFWDFQKP